MAPILHLTKYTVPASPPLADAVTENASPMIGEEVPTLIGAIVTANTYDGHKTSKPTLNEIPTKNLMLMTRIALGGVTHVRLTERKGL